MRKIFKAETFISLNIAILLISISLISYQKWQNKHHKNQQNAYQNLQAMQIAENQLALRMVKLPCETNITQNKILFNIECSHNEIRVDYPNGKFYLTL